MANWLGLHVYPVNSITQQDTVAIVLRHTFLDQRRGHCVVQVRAIYMSFINAQKLSWPNGHIVNTVLPVWSHEALQLYQIWHCDKLLENKSSFIISEYLYVQYLCHLSFYSQSSRATWAKTHRGQGMQTVLSKVPGGLPFLHSPCGAYKSGKQKCFWKDIDRKIG